MSTIGTMETWEEVARQFNLIDNSTLLGQDVRYLLECSEVFHSPRTSKSYQRAHVD